jgi:uncharacterized protein
MKKRVAILGASPNPQRYANMAQKQLLAKGHEVILVSPRYDEVEGLPCSSDVKNINEPIDTLTLYVNAEKSSAMADSILSLQPKRVIFNPGTENPELQKRLVAKNIEALEACTLVLLSLDQF